MSTLVLPRISKRIIESNCADPLDESLGHEIFSLLPPLSEAVHLCEVYLEHGKYLYAPSVGGVITFASHYLLDILLWTAQSCLMKFFPAYTEPSACLIFTPS